MTTKVEDIVAAIKTTLTNAGITVRDNTDALYSFEDKPVVVVSPGDEIPAPVVGQGFVYWDMEVSLLIGADGAEPKLAPEPTRQSAHAALYADRTLGGVVIDLHVLRVTRNIDSENPAAGITEAVYQFKYRVLENTV